MPRPTNKKELLDLADKNYDTLMEKIKALPEKKILKPLKNKRSMKDNLAHLTEWINMVIRWQKQGKLDINFKEMPRINAEIDKKHKTESLTKVLSDFKKAHGKMIRLISKHSDKELFTKKLYPWTGSTSMGSYFISATSSHYDWAIKKLKQI